MGKINQELDDMLEKINKRHDLLHEEIKQEWGDECSKEDKDEYKKLLDLPVGQERKNKFDEYEKKWHTCWSRVNKDKIEELNKIQSVLVPIEENVVKVQRMSSLPSFLKDDLKNKLNHINGLDLATGAAIRNIKNSN